MLSLRSLPWWAWVVGYLALACWMLGWLLCEVLMVRGCQEWDGEDPPEEV